LSGDNHGAMRLVDHPTLGPRRPATEVSFSFDGQPIRGRAGEPLIAALLAAGLRVLRTMPRTGEPRGGFCLVGRCADCLVMVDGVPNVLACQQPVQPDARVETQRGLGAWDRDG